MGGDLVRVCKKMFLQQFPTGVVEGMGTLAMPETWQTAVQVGHTIAYPRAAATTVGQAVIDQGKSIIATAGSVASDRVGAAAKPDNDLCARPCVLAGRRRLRGGEGAEGCEGQW